MAGIAVEGDDRRADQQARHKEVPHHPAGRGEPEEAVVRPDVLLQPDRLGVLDEDPAVPVHDRLGETGRARGVQDVQRVVERHLLELEGTALRDQLGPRRRALDRRVRVEVREQHGRGQPGQRRADLAHLGPAVDGLGAVPVALDGEQDLRVDLLEASHDAGRPELGGARRPHRAEAGGGQEGHEGLVDVGEVGDHTVPPTHAEALQSRPHARHLVAQIPEGQRARRPRLRDRLHRQPVGIAPQRPLRVAQRHVREPACARHRPLGEDPVGRDRRAQLAVVPDGRPERGEVVDRPPPQVVVPLEGEAALAFEPAEVAPQLRPLPDVGGRRPEDVAVGHPKPSTRMKRAVAAPSRSARAAL